MCMFQIPELVTWSGLKTLYGWVYSKTHTLRMMKDGRFPPRWKPPGEHRNSHPLWRREDLDAYFGLQRRPH